jgi:hypothetical protein
MRNWLVACLAPCALLISGCASIGNFTSIYRAHDLDSGDSMIVDAEQWAVLSIPDSERPGEEFNTVCAMPSPDAIAAAAASGNLTIDNAGGTGGGGGFSAGDASASIGLRTQSIQLLRDAMYRMCESYAANGIDRVEYGVMMRRFQSNMIAILAIEQLTGAIAAPAVQVTGPQANPGVASRLIDERERLEARNGAIEGELNAPTKPAQDVQDRLNTELRENRVRIAEIRDLLDRALQGDTGPMLANSSGAIHNSTIDASTAAALAQSVESITLAAMSTDYNTQMCFDMLRYQSFARTGDPPVQEDEEQATRPEIAGHVSSLPEYCYLLLSRDLENRLAADTAMQALVRRLSSDQLNAFQPGQWEAIRALLAQLDQGWSSGDLRDFEPRRPAESPIVGQKGS